MGATVRSLRLKTLKTLKQMLAQVLRRMTANRPIPATTGKALRPVLRNLYPSRVVQVLTKMLAKRRTSANSKRETRHALANQQLRVAQVSARYLAKRRASANTIKVIR